MGGIGSGRYGYCYKKKDTIEKYYSIDARQWKKEGLLAPRKKFQQQFLRGDIAIAHIKVCVEPNRIAIFHNHRYRNGDWKEEGYFILLNWTACRFGGQRVWFLCPYCDRRVAILYGGNIFACRRCHQLVYPSQRETKGEVAMRRADDVRQKLGWCLGLANGKGDKPKGMHWKTFRQLIAKHDELAQMVDDCMSDELHSVNALFKNLE